MSTIPDELPIDVMSMSAQPDVPAPAVIVALDPACLQERHDGLVQIWMTPTFARQLAMDLADSAASAEDGPKGEARVRTGNAADGAQ